MLSQPTRRIDASILVSEGSSSRVGIAIKNRQVGQLKDELAYQSNMLQMHSKGQVNQSPAFWWHWRARNGWRRWFCIFAG